MNYIYIYIYIYNVYVYNLGRINQVPIKEC